MQSLEVISVNFWQILISLLNLIILYAIIKKFLFKPVIKMIKNREAEIDNKYDRANEAMREANETKSMWNSRMQAAESNAEKIISDAAETAKMRGEKIVSEAKETAENMIHQAEVRIKLEQQKAQDDIKKEIVNVSSALAQKILKREVNIEDHKSLIDSFIENIGEGNYADK